MLFNLLALFGFLIVLLLLRRLVNILPSLMACLIRGKESINLEASVKLSRDRDLLALAMIIPFCLTVSSHRLYSPGILEGVSTNAYIGICFAVFFCYVLLRTMLTWLFRPKRARKTYVTAEKASYSFFITYTLFLLAAAAFLGVFDVAEATVRNVMLWISALIYALFMIRKIQIFSSSCSVFVAFLYLCALEMIPTGILVISAIIF